MEILGQLLIIVSVGIGAVIYRDRYYVEPDDRAALTLLLTALFVLGLSSMRVISEQVFGQIIIIFSISLAGAVFTTDKEVLDRKKGLMISTLAGALLATGLHLLGVQL